MMNKLILTFTILLLAGNGFISAQATPGEVTFSVTTLSNGGNFSPKHILAIWVEDDEGNFIKTLKLRADKRKQYLYTWNTKSSGNTVDAVTGSTLDSHTTHQVTWNCTNTSGSTVQDGDYNIRIEYTSEHAQGPMATVELTKSQSSFTAEPSDATYFNNMDIAFNPESSTGIALNETGISFVVYPVPASNQITLSLDIPRQMKASVKVYSIDMKLIEEVSLGVFTPGSHRHNLKLNSGRYLPGTYILMLEGDRFTSVRKFILE